VEGLSNVLLSKKGDIEQYKDLLDIVNKSAKRLQKLKENILDLTKIESQSLQLKKQRINLNEIILTVIAEYNNQIKNVKNLGISFIPKDDIFVEVDRLRISQVFDNILSNAIKFTKEGVIGQICIISLSIPVGTLSWMVVNITFDVCEKSVDRETFKTIAA
jgi:two-component system, OmpR family, sensor histidine kinase VicK